MGKITSLFVANLIVILGQIFASSIQKETSFIHEILLFIWALNILLVIIFSILIAIDRLILKRKSWILWIIIETILIVGLLLLSKHSMYFIAILLPTQYIKYFIYYQYKSKKEEKKR